MVLVSSNTITISIFLWIWKCYLVGQVELYANEPNFRYLCNSIPEFLRIELSTVVSKYCPTGDPTFFGNLPVHQVMKEAVKEAVDSDQFNGYGPAHGTVYTSEVLLSVTYYRSGVC